MSGVQYPRLLYVLPAFLIIVSSLIILTHSQPRSTTPTTNSWKTYTDPQGKFSFNYPPSWYFKAVPPENRSVAFFKAGEPARFFAYDLPGNELLIVGPYQVAYTPDEARQKPVLVRQNADFLQINGLPVVKTSDFIAIWPNESSHEFVSISMFDKTQPHLNRILSTFKFLNR